MRAIAFSVALSLILLSTAALADVPGLMSYQGTLTDEYGVAMDTTVSMTFVIYPGSLAVDGIWAETQPAVAVNDGIFNVLLGRVNALYADVFNGTSRWLGVQVGDDPELAPRQRIVSVGYAFQAAQADTAVYAKNVPSASDGDWNIYGNNLYSAVSGNVAIGSSGAYKLHVEDPSDSAGTYAILGVKTSTGTAQHLYGVCGHTLSSAVTGAGAGVLGLASDPDGGSAGVRGEAQGEVGRGVFAWATHGSGVNYGLYAVSSSPNGYAGFFESGKTYFGGDVGIGTPAPGYMLDVQNSSGEDTPIYGYKLTGSSTSAGVMGISGTRNYGYLGGEMGTSTEPFSNFNYGVYGRVSGVGWGGFGGMFYNTSGNWAALAGDDEIGYNLAVYGEHNGGNWGYIGSSHYGVYADLVSTGAGDYAIYGYGTDDVTEDGTTYGTFGTRGGVRGYNPSGPAYSFAVAGYSWLDDNRSGGTFGGRGDGGVWGCLAYEASGGTQYGGYATSWGENGGKGQVATGIGFGSWGDLFGADIHGKVYGLYSEGSNYGLYSHGAIFLDDLNVHLQRMEDKTTSILFTNVSTDVTVQTSGFSTLSKGAGFIEFDEDFRTVVSPDVPIVVTVTPTGNCNGVHVSEVTKDGFTVLENNAGKSDVTIAFIAIGRRAGYENPQLPQEVVSPDYVSKLSRGLHNDVDVETDGEGLYYEDGQIYVGKPPSNLPDLDKVREEMFRPEKIPALQSQRGEINLPERTQKDNMLDPKRRSRVNE